MLSIHPDLVGAAATSPPPDPDDTAMATGRFPSEAPDGAGEGEDWMHGFRVGDMVWGKVKSHPWWPGHIYNEALAAAAVRRTRREGRHVLVAFFGDSSYGWFDPAELIPFAPHFAEKAAQTTARAFAAAVAEAADEAARRAALAVTCLCRHPDNFRPAASQPGYLTVDVPGFERGAVYSDEQIAEARALFVPERAVGFVQSLAVAPREDAGAKDVEFIQMMAMLAAYRRATFEEFDETYAQAFGVDPVRTAPGEEQVAQRAAPLAGKQKTPEVLGGRRGGSAAARLMAKLVPSAAAIKVTSSKKNQFLLKRRDDARVGPLPASPEPSHRPGLLPDIHQTATTVNNTASANTPGLDQTPPGFSNDTAAQPVHGDDEYVLQRRAPPAAAPAAYPVDGQESEGVVTMDVAPKKVKEKKIRKREREEPADVAITGEVKKKKKKKQLTELDSMASAAHDAAPSSSRLLRQEQSRAVSALPLPELELDSLDLPQVVSDLQDLALDPFYGAGRHASDTACGFALAFRLKFYQKSLANAPPGELDASDARSGRTSVELASGQPSLPKLVKKKQVLRPDDPAKAGRKRGPSDRQEELTVKKKKKLDKIKTLAAEKKSGLNQKDTGAPAANATPVAAALQGSAVQQSRPSKKSDAPLKKKEPAAPIRTPSPTALMMKFPPKSTLPSVASLKARFARFGQLDLDGIRVYWKSHMCKVIYRFKSDAQIALNYARNNDIFGQVKAHYYLREVESSGPEPASDSAAQWADPRSTETPSFRPGSSGNVTAGSALTQPRPLPLRTPLGQPKSILKKSTDDGVSTMGSTTREAPRVKFMLDGGDSKIEPPPSAASANGNGNGSNGADTSAGKILKSVSFLSQPLQPPARPAQPRSQPSRAAPSTQHLQPLPPPTPPLVPFPPRAADGLPRMTGGLGHADGQPSPLGRNGQPPQTGYIGGNGKPGVDISSQMLKLLVQCNDIVNVVKSSLGYVPYHPI